MKYIFPTPYCIIPISPLLFCLPSVGSLCLPNIFSPGVKITSLHNLPSYNPQCWHSYSPPQWCWIYYCLTPTHRTSVPRFISPPKKSLWDILSSLDELVYWQHLVFYLQKHIVIFLLFLAVRNSPFHVPYVLPVLLVLLQLIQILQFSALLYSDVSSWVRTLGHSSLSITKLLPSFKQVTEASISFLFILFFSFNKQLFTALKVYFICTSFNEGYENPQNESRKEEFCSFTPQNLVFTFYRTGCWEIPWLHSRDYRSFHISDVPQHDFLKNN